MTLLNKAPQCNPEDSIECRVVSIIIDDVKINIKSHFNCDKNINDIFYSIVKIRLKEIAA